MTIIWYSDMYIVWLKNYVKQPMTRSPAASVISIVISDDPPTLPDFILPFDIHLVFIHIFHLQLREVQF